MRHPPTPAPRSRPRALVRGLLSLFALLLLVLGVPVLLWQIGTLPDSVPSLEVLLAPDDGTLLLTTMTVAAWGAWLWLTVPVLIEVVAVLIQRTTPRLPGMATGQKLAGFLLGSILLASPAAAAAATPAVAASAPQAADISATVGAAAEGAEVRQALKEETPDAPPSAATALPATLGAEATWWELAEEHLGDGSRYGELQRLNPELPADSVLPVGTVVRVPGDAAAGGPRVQLAAAENPGGGGRRGGHSVGNRRGRARRWREVWRAVRGEQVPSTARRASPPFEPRPHPAGAGDHGPRH